MATNYPGAIDALTNPTAGDALTSPSHAAQHANVNDAVEAVQAELGTLPKGSAASVKARLEGVENGSRLTLTSLLTTKGDLVARDTSTAVRLPVGADGTVLQADAGSAAGVRWGTQPTFTVGPTPPVSPPIGSEWADTSSPPLTVIRKWTGVSWLVWLVTDAVVPAIGEAAWGGYMAGIIDTTRVGSIDGTDASQVGLRYLLIVSPKSIEYTTGLKWKTAATAGPAATNTRWDGLTATEAMYAAGADYEAATYCRNLLFPSDGGSRWYLPAKNELELLYRNLKPTTEVHYDASGANIASDPTGAAYTPGSADNPSRTGITVFQQGEAQALEGVSSPYYWSSSEHSALGAWLQVVGGTSAGFQVGDGKAGTFLRVRPVRRFVL